MSQTKIIKQSFQVNFNFDLIFSSHVFHQDNSCLLNVLSVDAITKSKAIIIVDQEVVTAHKTLKKDIKDYFEAYKERIELCGPILEIVGGEESKNDESFIKTILQQINDYGIDRHSYVIGIGGGAVLDAVGFAAAVAHRGVRLIRIPTTVLSQNDSGIGVKNGINYFKKKNFAGSFAVPYAVINDDEFLTTLDDRDWRSGISEAIKVALIKDYDFFNWIENHVEALNSRDKRVMNELIYRCADLHMKHIQNSGDAFEQGSSRPLDFGHWAAHKLEQLTQYELRHGEAVAIGIALDSTYAHLKGYLGQPELNRILDCILNLGFHISHHKLNKDIIKGLEEFREHLGGKLTIMLLESLGSGIEVYEMDKDLVLLSIEFMNTYSSQNSRKQC